MELGLCRSLIGDIKRLIRQAQAKVAVAVNTELVGECIDDIRKMILLRQQNEGWEVQ